MVDLGDPLYPAPGFKMRPYFCFMINPYFAGKNLIRMNIVH